MDRDKCINAVVYYNIQCVERANYKATIQMCDGFYAAKIFYVIV